MKKLFRVAGLGGDDALDCDSWTHRITVHNLKGFRGSLFWIEPDALKGFSSRARWVDSLDAPKRELPLRAKGLLMSLVDSATRERWLAKVKTAPAEEGREASLFEAWAEWDLEAALLAVVKAEHPESARNLANAATYGPFPGQLWNASRHVFRVLTEFDYLE